MVFRRLVIKPQVKLLEVYHGFFKVTGYTPRLFKKVIDKVNNNIYSGEVIDLKTTDFNFTI